MERGGDEEEAFRPPRSHVQPGELLQHNMEGKTVPQCARPLIGHVPVGHSYSFQVPANVSCFMRPCSRFCLPD